MGHLQVHLALAAALSRRSVLWDVVDGALDRGYGGCLPETLTAHRWCVEVTYTRAFDKAAPLPMRSTPTLRTFGLARSAEKYIRAHSKVTLSVTCSVTPFYWCNGLHPQNRVLLPLFLVETRV